MEKDLDSFVNFVCNSNLQDGRIDYNEFVAMMHNGGTPSTHTQLNGDFSVPLSEPVPVC